MEGAIDMDGNSILDANSITANGITSGTITVNNLYDLDAGSITFGSNLDGNNVQTIINLPAPTNGGDAANKTYVDGQDALKLSLTGGTMSGAIDMDYQYLRNPTVENATLVTNLDANSQKIISLATPVDGGDAANKTYVDGAAATAESNANVYTDTAISQEITERNNAIKAQSFTATVLSEDWLFDNTINSWYAVVTHNLGDNITISTFYDGSPAEFTGELSGNDYYLRSNIQPVESTVINIVKAGGNL